MRCSFILWLNLENENLIEHCHIMYDIRDTRSIFAVELVEMYLFVGNFGILVDFHVGKKNDDPAWNRALPL